MNTTGIRLRITLAWTLLLAGTTGAARGQSDVAFDLRSPQARTQSSAAWNARANLRRQSAQDLAREQGWIMRGADEDGGLFELVQLIDHRPVYFRTLNLDAAISTATDAVRNTAPFEVDGHELIAGIWDGGGVLTNHVEFSGRAKIKDGAAPIHHATHVGGTIGAVGSHPSALGMAPAVIIHSYDWHNDFGEMAGRAATGPAQPANIYVSNHSYGLLAGWAGGSWSGYSGPHWFGAQLSDREDRRFGQYNEIARDLDDLCHSALYFLPFWAAGNDRNDNAPAAGATFYYYDVHLPGWVAKNYDPDADPHRDGWKDGGYNTISGSGIAKNSLTLGAVSDAVSDGVRSLAAATMTTFSGWGPADDGRIKPDIVANGIGLFSPLAGSITQYGRSSGTSMAAPNASGSALLLSHLYRDRLDGRNMRAATLKGLILHTADDLGNPGPDYRFGWGLMNTLSAALLILQHANQPDAMHIREDVLNADTPLHRFPLAWNGTDAIRVTLSWTDPPGSAQTELNHTAPALVNDLDLRVRAPDGTTLFFPFVLDPANPAAAATTGDNSIDNIEQVYIANPPQPGIYVLEVSHKGSLDDNLQTYSLIASGQETDNVLSIPFGSVIRGR